MQSNKLPWRGKASLKQKASGQKSSFDLLVQSLPYQVKSFEPLQFDIPANVKVYGPVPQPPASSEASNSHLVPLAQMAARQKVVCLCFYINSGLNAVLRFFSRNIRLYILFVITLTWSVNSNGKVCSQNISIPLCLSKLLKTCNAMVIMHNRPILISMVVRLNFPM